MTSMTIGNMSAISRPATSEVPVSSSFTVPKRPRLLALADEGAHDPDAGDLLAQHLVDVVEPLLHHAELRDHAADDGAERDRPAPAC